MIRLFAALYASEQWHSFWRSHGSLYAKARAIILYDRIITGADHRVLLNGRPLDEYVEEQV